LIGKRRLLVVPDGLQFIVSGSIILSGEKNLFIDISIKKKELLLPPATT